MERYLIFLICLFPFLAFAAVDTFDGQIGIDIWDGQAGVDTIDGQVISSGGAAGGDTMLWDATDDALIWEALVGDGLLWDVSSGDKLWWDDSTDQVLWEPPVEDKVLWEN